ncbi:hypothetical protein Tco_0246973 [Tanacetum coccineum]
MLLHRLAAIVQPPSVRHCPAAVCPPFRPLSIRHRPAAVYWTSVTRLYIECRLFDNYMMQEDPYDDEALNKAIEEKGKWLGSRQKCCNWATKGAATSDEKQGSDSKTVRMLKSLLTAMLLRITHSIRLILLVTQLKLHRHFYSVGAGVIEEVRLQRDKGFDSILDILFTWKARSTMDESRTRKHTLKIHWDLKFRDIFVISLVDSDKTTHRTNTTNYDHRDTKYDWHELFSNRNTLIPSVDICTQCFHTRFNVNMMRNGSRTMDSVNAYQQTEGSYFDVVEPDPQLFASRHSVHFPLPDSGLVGNFLDWVPVLNGTGSNNVALVQVDLSMMFSVAVCDRLPRDINYRPGISDMLFPSQIRRKLLLPTDFRQKWPSMTTTVVNNSLFRSLFENQKLTGNNFLEWYRNLRIVLSTEDKLPFLEQSIPALPVPPQGQANPPDVITTHQAWVKAQKEIVRLMLMTMDPEIQKTLEHLGAYDMLKELKTLYVQQAGG